MARGISAAAKTAAAAGIVYPCAFIKIEFDSEDWLTWTGYGNITVDGDVYIGTGTTISISLPSETADLTAQPLQAAVSGLDDDMLTLALAEPYQGRVVTIYQGFLTEAGDLVGPPDVWTRARLDTMEVEESGETSDLNIQAETKLRDLRRPMTLFYTPEDQAALFPSDNDKFFEFVPTIADVQVYWGDQDIDD